MERNLIGSHVKVTMMDNIIRTRRRRLGDDKERTFISYKALEGDYAPCNQPGHSYYNCATITPVNPYVRACSVITNCARQTD